MNVPFLDLAQATAEIRPELDEAIRSVLNRGSYLLGPELEAFEAAFAHHVGAPHCVAVASGLDALTLGLEVLGVGPRDEVIVPANTFIATWLAVSRVGARPVPVEPIPGTWNMDPAAVEAALTPRTRAILPVHLFGQPADLGALMELAHSRGLALLEDAAQAHGASFRGRPIGAHGNLAAWSFYPGKNLGCLGDGGALTTHDEDQAERLRALRNYGSLRKYHHVEKGVNSRLDEIQAAVLRVKLPRLAQWNGRRREVAARYFEGLAGCPGLRLPQVAADVVPCWHLFVVDVEDRDIVQQALAARGVQTMIHYPVPPHLSGAYLADGPWPALPVTVRAAESHLSLPMGPHLDPEQQDWVVRSLWEILAARRA